MDQALVAAIVAEVVRQLEQSGSAVLPCVPPGAQAPEECEDILLPACRAKSLLADP